MSWNLVSPLLYVSCKHGQMNIKAGRVQLELELWKLMKMIKMMILVEFVVTGVSWYVVITALLLFIRLACPSRFVLCSYVGSLYCLIFSTPYCWNLVDMRLIKCLEIIKLFSLTCDDYLFFAPQCVKLTLWFKCLCKLPSWHSRGWIYFKLKLQSFLLFL